MKGTSAIRQEADPRENAVHQLGTVDREDVWSRLGRYWSRIDAELDPTTDSKLNEDTIIDLGTMLAKLERNLIAGLGSHQEKAMYVFRLCLDIANVEENTNQRYEK
jgi:hypothetical protein